MCSGIKTFNQYNSKEFQNYNRKIINDNHLQFRPSKLHFEKKLG